MNIFKSITKYSDITIDQTGVKTELIETEFGTLSMGFVTIEIYAPISVYWPNILDIRTFLGCIECHHPVIVLKFKYW